MPAAQVSGTAATVDKLTAEGVVVGTIAYMAPEQALGKAVDHRSDIFSCGVVLYELLTGRLPFAGQSSLQLLDALLHHDPPSIARYNDQVPDALVRVVGKLLEKDREDRYQSAHAVWSDLRRIRDELTGARPGVAARTRARPARHAPMPAVDTLVSLCQCNHARGLGLNRFAVDDHSMV